MFRSIDGPCPQGVIFHWQSDFCPECSKVQADIDALAVPVASNTSISAGGALIQALYMILLGLIFVSPAVAFASDAEPSLRNKPAMAFDEERGRVVLFGGLDGNGRFFSDTWEWDGSRWARVSLLGPSARALSSMTFDSTSKKLVLFGGEDASGVMDDTWFWEGTSWQRTDAPGPPARSAHELVYDRDRQRVVMFGGSTGAGKPYLDDTWEFDGHRWIKIDVVGPSPRAFYGMVYDEKIRKVVLFAGRPANADTWTYDGVRWTDVTSPGPTARDHHAMAYDRLHKNVILFGGGAFTDNKLVELGDTWQWDGEWRQVRTSNALARNAKPNMVFDSSRKTVLIFGGANHEHFIGELWEWDGRRWHPFRNYEYR